PSFVPMKIIIAAFTIDNTAFAAIGALAGVIFTLIFGCLRDYWTRKAEKERHIRELSVKAAIEQWKTERKRADITHEKVKSLRLQVARFLVFSEILSKKPDANAISESFITSNAII